MSIATLLFVPMIAASMFMEALAITTIWFWLIGGTMNMSSAIGITLVIRLITGHFSSFNGKTVTEFIVASFTHIFFRPLLALGIAWVVKTWFM